MLLRFALFVCLVALLYASGIGAATSPVCQSSNCISQSSVAAAPPPSQQANTYTICYKFAGRQARTSLDTPYTIAVLLTGSFGSAVGTSTATPTTPAGMYVTLLSGSGSFTILNRYNSTITYPITSLGGLRNFTDTYARFYISNVSFPQFVDANGLILNLGDTYEFPGKQYISQFNVTRLGVYGAVTQSGISALDPTTFRLSASVGSVWTGTQYVAGSCVPALHPIELIPVKSAVAVYNVSFSYSYSGTTLQGWRISTSVALQTDGGVYGPDGLGDYWFQLDTSLVAANGSALGQRQYFLGGSLLYQSSVSAASTPTTLVKQGSIGTVDNRVYLYPPYLSYAGVGYNFFYQQPIPGMAGIQKNRNFTSVNVYVNTSGVLSEAFPNSTEPDFDGGTVPRLTTISVSFVRA